MRVKIVNQSLCPDHIVIPLVEYAATFFPHRTGRVTVTLKNSRRGLAHGVCYPGHAVIWMEREDNSKRKYPCEYDQMHYFRHANHEAVATLVAHTYQEYCLSVIAHELEHTTKGNRRMRRSRQEIHAWNRGVEVVEASRTLEGQAFIQARTAEIVRSQQHRQDRKAFAKSPEAKRENVEKLMTKWARQLQLAQTKIRKLKIRAKYFDKKIAASGSQKGTMK